MEITRLGSRPSTRAPEDYFTGSVRLDPLFKPPEPARVVGLHVTFEPGARTAWHTHRLGQTLVITSGCALIQKWDGPIEKLSPGDVVWIPPDVKHWHGATPTMGMTHLAVQEALNGETTDWLEKVTDEQYHG